MIRIFLIKTEEGLVCLNETSDEMAEKHLASGGRELTPEECEVFKDRANWAGDKWTHIEGDELESAVVTYDYPSIKELEKQHAETIRINVNFILNKLSARIETSNEQKELVDAGLLEAPDEPRLPLLKYRQELRDLPQQEGFPWLNKETPWPIDPLTIENTDD